jgi:lysozyme
MTNCYDTTAGKSDHSYLDDLTARYLVVPLNAALTDQSENPNTQLRTSANGRSLIEAFEGCDRPIASKPGFFTTYYDEVGVLTLGFGHTNLGNIAPHISQGDVWSQEDCDSGLNNDLARFEADVIRLFPNTALTQDQLDCLVSFDLNTGDLARSSIPAKIIAGNLTAAMATLLQYDHAGGQVLTGLMRRRRAEMLMFNGDVASALILAGAQAQSGARMAKASLPPKGETTSLKSVYDIDWYIRG